ncbi:MAG: hypothetical protein ACFFDI_21835 [Promethearchaeota archaeon]
MSDEKFVRYFYYPDPDLGTNRGILNLDAHLITLEDYRWLEHRVKQLEARLKERESEPL